MPTTSQSLTTPDFDINTTQLTEDLAQACLTATMIDKEHVPFLSNLLKALFARDIAAMEREMAAFKDTPEDIYLPLRALCHVWGKALRNSTMHCTRAGMLELDAITDAYPDPQVYGAGAIKYYLSLNTNKPASGYHTFLDTNSGLGREKCGVISAWEALYQVVRLFLVEVQRLYRKVPADQDKMVIVFGINAGPAQLKTVLEYRQTVRFEKDLRAFFIERESAKNGSKLAYLAWRCQNWRDIKTYEGEIKARAKYKS